MSCSTPLETQPIENEAYKRLIDCEEDLVFQVCAIKVKLVNFSDDLYKSMVISKEVKDTFSNLDHDKLTSRVRARYLLQHVCEGVKHDVTVFHRFVKVLAMYGGSAYRVSRHLSKQLGVFEREKECQSSDGLGSSKPMLADINLSEGDVHILMETLVEVGNRWEEIGISLHLSKYTIDHCRGSSNAICLSNILSEWMSCYEQKNITLKKLKLALASPVVGLSSFALTMEKSFRKAKSTKNLTTEKERSGSEGQASDEEGNSEPAIMHLSEDDIAILSELLAEYAHKWNLIGTSLGLPVSIMKELEAKRTTSESDVLCLRDILMQWITGKHQIARDTTFNNLKLTLKSQLVGLRAVAYHLEERFRDARRQYMLSVPSMPAAKRPHLDTTLRIILEPSNTEAMDGKSTILELLVDPNTVSYQWMKDEKSLSNGAAYSGVHTDILCIKSASQGTDGKYTCEICKGSEQVISRSVVLTVNFSSEKKHLLNFYSRNRVVPHDTWPPVCTGAFINVALVSRDKSPDNYNYCISGDVVDTLERKEMVEFEEVFGKYENGALVLVEGPPGSGKSTLLHKATTDWANGGKMLKDAKLVFHIILRKFAKKKIEHLKDLLGNFCRDQDECETVLRSIERSQGEGVCFLIDGLDEYGPQDESNSVIYELLQKTHLPAAMIIVASRPAATSSLRREAPVTKRIEVLGFNQQQIFEYIDHYPFSFDKSNYSASVSNLKGYLLSHRNALHICYLPVHASMVCFLYNHMRNDIPRTERKMYEHVAISIVLRKLRGRNRGVRLFSLKDIDGKEGDHFRKICHLAFEMTVLSKQVVHQRDTDVPLSCDTGPVDAPSLGFITIDNAAGLYGLEQTYTFLHLTFQEYLTAFYITTLDEDQQMEMIRLYADSDHMQVVWKFYCGMVMFEERLEQIKLIMKHASTLYGVQCALESQQIVVCDSVLKFGDTRTLDLIRCNVTPTDLTAVGYVISTTSYRVTEVVVRWCELNDDHVGAFLKEVTNDKLGYLLALDLSYNNVGAEGVTALSKRLKSCFDLQRLALSSNNIGAGGAAALAVGLKSCTNLQSLALSDNNIGAEGAKALVVGLKYCNHLQALDLSGNNVDFDGAAALAEGLKSCNNLQTLDLSDNNVGAQGAAALAEGLKSCNNLQTLDLSDNNIGPQGAAALNDGLRSCSNLQMLYLSHNNIGLEGVAALVDLKDRGHVVHD